MSIFNLGQKINLAKNFITKNSPLYVQFYITPRCNLACEQCNIIYSDAKHNEIEIDKINKIANNLSKIGVSIVLLIGGEPFVRKDIDQIVRAFTKKNIHVRLQTNGIATEAQLESCVKAGGRDISISLDTLEGSKQDEINGGFLNSWNRAINTISLVNKVFPDNSTAFFNSVIMPKNLNAIPKVIKFATKIGWGVSLVPVHVSSKKNPMAYRTIDDDNQVTFGDTNKQKEEIVNFIELLKSMKEKYNLYDSVEYIEDIENFLLKKPLQWRKKNDNVCDSPSLYFAISPSGSLKTCCDFEALSDNYVYDDNFPDKYFSGEIHKSVLPITRDCEGCMYGSYPEITIISRYFKSFFEKVKYFNYKTPKLQRYSFQDLNDLAKEILNEQS